MSRSLTQFAGGLVIGALALSAGTMTRANEFRLDFRNDSTPGEPAFDHYVWGSGNSVTNLSETYASPLASGTDITVALGGPGLDARSRNSVADPQGELARDFLWGDGDAFTVTFSGLTPGLYSLTTYHHDRDNSSAVMGATNLSALGAASAAFQYVVSTGLGTISGGTSGPPASDTLVLAVGASGELTMTASGASGGTRAAATNGLVLANGVSAPASARLDFGPSAGHTSPVGFSPWVAGPIGSQAVLYEGGIGGFITVDVFQDGADNRATDRSGSDPLFTDVLMNNGTLISLTLGNLAEGDHDLTLFHGTDGNSFSGVVEVWIDGSLEGAFAQQPFGSETFQLFSDGLNPILVEYRKAPSGAPGWLHLAGMELSNFQAPPVPEQVIPEPGSAVLFGLSGLLLALRHRRRR